MTGNIYVGVGGWTYEPWRGVFYPEKLAQKQELAYMGVALQSLDIVCGALHFLRCSTERFNEQPKGPLFDLRQKSAFDP